jgi:hypothetical protein
MKLVRERSLTKAGFTIFYKPWLVNRGVVGLRIDHGRRIDGSIGAPDQNSGRVSSASSPALGLPVFPFQVKAP